MSRPLTGPATYVSTSIPYVNAAPHLGHALELVQADVFARAHRLLGHDTYFLTGTDDNSLKNVLTAEREGLPVDVLVRRNADIFAELAAALRVSNDDFIRTSADPRHAPAARALWEACARGGDVYRHAYRGLYCVGCEQFYADDELDDGRCPEHGTRPEVVEEENWFFRLSRYQEALLALLDGGRPRILPDSRWNEVRAFVAGGLADFSISRSRERARGWGIPVPGDPTQVLYVWFDALANYVSALGYGDPDDRLYRRYWEQGRKTHVIGKGILRFHAVSWPAILLSAGLPLPDTLFVHGYLTVGGQKIGKSLDNAVDPLQLVERYGPDGVRYWLLREVPPTGDADFTEERLATRYTQDLANGLGNLRHRTLGLLERYRRGLVPAPSVAVDQALRASADALALRVVDALVEEHDPRAALVAIWDVVAAGNRAVEVWKPWQLASAEAQGDSRASQQLDSLLYGLAEALRLVAEALRPLLPDTAERIAAQLGADQRHDWRARLRWGGLRPGTEVRRAEMLFPRLDR